LFLGILYAPLQQTMDNTDFHQASTKTKA